MARYIIANWESHATLKTAEQWFRDFRHYYTPLPEVEVILAPAFVFLHDLRQAISKQRTTHLSLAVQDLSPFPFGNYTGAVAAGMVRDLVKYAIVGHSSRRRYFHETHQEIANKASEAAANGIIPVLCLDLPYAAAQIAALEDAALEMLITVFEPDSGIGVNTMPDPSEAAEAIETISRLAPGRPVLYGGPLKPDNAAAYLNLEGVAGLLVGSASLDPIDFARICLEAAREKVVV